ncbi:AraC family transcriptional regulator [Chondromyces crocatus]|uniref:AraC family transcriptional regulator n=1 Tax=Chondromyces crocatus TaxID=52 RepID=A0A0K1EJE2_CHOCO|nr:AraC family transcriptional regulator [Chondromyces crocatus]AKT40980.1 AraC family transcriptional regulator [Chondromyces crocatus]
MRREAEETRGEPEVKGRAEEATPTMWARAAARMVAYAVGRGAVREALVARLGAPEAVLADPDGRVPLVGVYAVLEAAAEATRDARFGLHFALELRVEDLDTLGFLMVTSPDFGGCLSRLLRYQRLWNDGERFALSVEGDVARLSYAPFGAAREAHRHMAEALFVDLLINGGRSIPGLQAAQVRFTGAAVGDGFDVAGLFGVPVVYGAEQAEVVFPAASLTLPLLGANAALCAVLDQHARVLLERVPVAPGLSSRVRALIAARLHEGEVGLASLAEAVRMSARTLQRRLKDEGMSLHGLLDDVRREQALALLGGGAAIAEVAWSLGYSEPSAFHRAFRRWTGQTPEAFRAGAAARS